MVELQLPKLLTWVRFPSPAPSIALGGLIAGTVDIGAASLIYSLPPRIILKAIASGLLGAAAFRGGWPTALLGLLLQWLMSLIIATVYVLARRRLFSNAPDWVLSGIVYGVVVFFVMNWVVVPLSAARGSHFTVKLFTLNLIAMLLFGLIVAFFARGLQRAARAPLQV
jgi:uncharacterized membrane protein YagU involved in acid resistance